MTEFRLTAYDIAFLMHEVIKHIPRMDGTIPENGVS